MELIQASADFVFAGLWYNVQRRRYYENLEHGGFSADDMKMTMPRCGTVLKPERPGHQLGMLLYSGECYPDLWMESEEEEIVHEDRKQGLQNKETRVSPVFGLETHREIQTTHLWWI